MKHHQLTSFSDPPRTLATLVSVLFVAWSALSLYRVWSHDHSQQDFQYEEEQQEKDEDRQNPRDKPDGESSSDGSIVIPSTTTTTSGKTSNDTSRDADRAPTSIKSCPQRTRRVPTQEQGNSGDWTHHLPPHMQREQMKEQRRREKLPLLALKSKLYDNITMLDPQGQALCKISRKKARWYVLKNLAEWTTTTGSSNSGDSAQNSTYTTAIQLRFEPKSRSADHDYARSTKQNICVACGSNAEKHQMRFYIVPHVYRNLFPKQYKTHMSHDIVLLCSDCHLICGRASNLRMKELEEKFHPQPMYHVDHELYKIRSSALALMNWHHKIPQEHIARHESNVRLYFQQYNTVLGDKWNDDDESGSGSESPKPESFTRKQLQQVIDLDYRIRNPNFVPGPELVVQSLVHNHEAMSEFIKDWRRFFLDTIHPRHLPKGWSVDYSVTCDM